MVARSVSAHRIAAVQNPDDQIGNGRVQIILLAGRRILMCCSGILENPDDLFFGKDVVVVQREQQRFANGQRGGSSDVVGHGHDWLCFQVWGTKSDLLWPEYLAIIGAICYRGLIQSSLKRLFSVVRFNAPPAVGPFWK